ncbi:MAG: hypothetical protein ACE14W_12485 [Candidatus Velamenicoccus archaeovorus]
MFDESTVEQLLDDLLSTSATDRGDALAQLMAAATVINRDWEQVLAGKPFTAVAVERGRLRKWTERLAAKAEEYANAFGAVSLSVSVGWPAGIAVSLTWDARTG